MKTQNHKRLVQNIQFIWVFSMMSFTLYGVDAPVTTVGTTCNAVVGQPVTVPITVTGFSNIGSFYLILNYNYSQLQYSSATKNPLLTGNYTVNDYNLGGNNHIIILSWSGGITGKSLSDGSSIVNLVFNFSSGPAELNWNISSDDYCKYTDPNVVKLNDSPKSSFYINGIVSSTSTVTPIITPSGPTTFCNGGSVTLNSSPGSAYLWSNGATTQSIIVTTSGNFSVTVTDAEGCKATSTPTVVTVNSQTAEPTVACYETATWNSTTCVWDITGSQPEKPAKVNCWDNYVFNTTTCAWVNQGTQPVEPSKVNCWDNYVFNTTTCVWVNQGTQPVEPSKVNCWDNYQFNTTLCAWENKGTEPVKPAKVNCSDDFVFVTATCSWVNQGTQPTEPVAVNCWDEFSFNTTTCAWVNQGTQPVEPTKVNCWDNFVFNTTKCAWVNQGAQPEEPTAENCWDEYHFNTNECIWENLGSQPEKPDVECYGTATWNPATCAWDVTGTQPEKPTVACYETATWNGATCKWDVTGTQPEKPSTVNCWDNYVFNTTTCVWVNQGTQPVEPSKVNCWDNYQFNTTLCAWENKGTEPVKPAKVNCSDDFVFVTATCSWVNQGTQPTEPVAVNCWDEFSFNTTTCAWVNQGTQPVEPTKVNCWDNFVFNTTKCAWVNQGAQPEEPTAENCWDEYHFNTNECIWENLGSQPEKPDVECYGTATWNPATCAWDVTGTQPEKPTVACYETATWNGATCKWDVTGTQPEKPSTVNCWDNYVFNTTTCVWVNQGTQPVEPSKVNCWDNYQFNTTLCAWENKGTEPVKPAKVNCSDDFVFVTATCSWVNQGTQPTEPVAVNCWDEFSFNTNTCVWDNIGSKPTEPTKVNCWDNYVFNTTTCTWVNQGTQPFKPTASVTMQPTCITPTGTIVVTVPAPSTYITYTVTGPSPAVSAVTHASASFYNLAPGIYAVTTTNLTMGCTSPATSLTVNAVPGVPSAPIVGTITQPTCAQTTGSLVLTGLPSGTWTINPGNITGTGSTKTISGLIAGTYNFTVSSGTCTSPATANVVITPPTLPSPPIVGTITQPTCCVATGSVVLTGLPSGTWTLTRNPGGAKTTGTGTSVTIKYLASGTYTFTITNAAGCTSESSANVVIKAYIPLSVNISAGTIAVYGGTTTLTAAATGGTTPYLYSLKCGEYQSGNTFIVGAGTYTVTVKDVNGCTKESNTITITQPTPCNRETTLTYTGTKCVQYGSIATLSAVLWDTRYWRGVSGKTITFNIGSQTATAVTNNSGVATTTLVIKQAPGCYWLYSTFAGDVTYKASNDKDDFTVNRRSLTAGLTGTVSKKYDGNTKAFMSPENYTLTGMVSGDDVSLYKPATGTYDNKNVGAGKTVTVSGLTLTGTKSGFYSLSCTTVSARIGKITATKSGEIATEIITAVNPMVEYSDLKVYPNPFSERLHFEFVSPESVNVRIDLYDMTGRMVKTIFDQPIDGGVNYEAEFKPETIISGMYIYRMTLGNVVYNGKVVFKKE